MIKLKYTMLLFTLMLYSCDSCTYCHELCCPLGFSNYNGTICDETASFYLSDYHVDLSFPNLKDDKIMFSINYDEHDEDCKIKGDYNSSPIVIPDLDLSLISIELRQDGENGLEGEFVFTTKTCIVQLTQ